MSRDITGVEHHGRFKKLIAYFNELGSSNQFELTNRETGKKLMALNVRRLYLKEYNAKWEAIGVFQSRVSLISSSLSSSLAILAFFDSMG